jgi:large repetitive protein
MVSQGTMDYRSAVLDDGPKAYWRLGEATGTTAEDETANNVDATYYNSPTLGITGPLAGDGNTAVDLDGVDDEIARTNASFNTDTFSVELWAKPDQLRVQGLVTKSNATSSWRLFMRDTSGHLEFDAVADTYNCPTSGNDTLTAGTWSHVVATYSKVRQESKIYIDGTLRATCSSIATMGGTWNSPVTVGGSALNRWDGKVDEFAFYGYPLPAQTVGNHFALGPRDYRALVTRDAPVGYWRLGESSGTTALDETARHLNGTYSGGMALGATGAIAGDSNTAADADGSNDQMAVAANAALNNDSFSTEAWVRPDQLRVQMIVYKNYASSWRLFMNDASGHVEFDALADTKNCATSGDDKLAANTWTHVVATYDKTKQEMKVYLDGSLRVTCAGVADVGGSFNAGLTIGSQSSYYWDGKFDEVAYYNFALTPKSIADHYAQKVVQTQDSVVLGDGPVAYWRLGDQTGTTARDETRNANDGAYTNGTLIGQPGAVVGDADESARFDGVDDAVTVSGSSTLNNLNQISLEGWVYLNSFGEASLGRLISRSGGNQIFFVNGSGGYLQFEALRWQTAIGKWRSPGGSVDLNRWHHVVVTYDYSSTANDPAIYIDGQAVTVTEVQAPSGTLGTGDTGTIYLGNTSDGARTFDGRIDDAAYYDYALTPEQVKHHYGETAKYGYDAEYELTSVQYPDAATDTYTYDRNGNRLTKNSTSYTYNAADRMLTAGETSYGLR